MLEDLDLSAIHEENAWELIQRLLNLVEQLAADLREAQAEIQRLRDENNHLKGEQGKPQVKGNVKTKERQDHSVWLEKVTLIMGCLFILKLIAPVKDKASLSFFKVQNSKYLS